MKPQHTLEGSGSPNLALGVGFLPLLPHSKVFQGEKARRAVVRHVVPGADHTFNSLPWELQVLALMLDWFRCNFSC